VYEEKFGYIFTFALGKSSEEMLDPGIGEQ